MHLGHFYVLTLTFVFCGWAHWLICKNEQNPKTTEDNNNADNTG